MSKYITLGADENGQVYGLELGEDGEWVRNPLGYSTSCVVIRPMSREDYEYVTEDPESAKEIWKSCVAADRTELGLEEWFKEYVAYDDPIDSSFVFELLDDESNPTVAPFGMSDANDGSSKFREHLKKTLLESPDVGVSDEDDVYSWEASGWFPPKKPFVVEFAPKELLEEYYAHLRKTYKEFEDEKAEKNIPQAEDGRASAPQASALQGRCSLETAFYVVVEAHNAEEAEIVAENWCRKSDEKREDGLFWSSEASHMHPKFEAEED